MPASHWNERVTIFPIKTFRACTPSNWCQQNADANVACSICTHKHVFEWIGAHWANLFAHLHVRQMEWLRVCESEWNGHTRAPIVPFFPSAYFISHLFLRSDAFFRCVCCLFVDKYKPGGIQKQKNKWMWCEFRILSACFNFILSWEIVVCRKYNSEFYFPRPLHLISPSHSPIFLQHWVAWSRVIKDFISSACPCIQSLF